jgi:hypothetical protein
MDILFRILLLILVATASFFLVTPLTVNLLLMAGVLENSTSDFINRMMNLSTYIWLGSIIPAIASIFVKQKWRLVLLLCPVILPTVFLIIFATTQS